MGVGLVDVWEGGGERQRGGGEGMEEVSGNRGGAKKWKVFDSNQVVCLFSGQ